MENKDKIKIEIKQANKISKILWECINKKIHPTEVLCLTISAFYGHKIELKKFIKLIETSPL